LPRRLSDLQTNEPGDEHDQEDLTRHRLENRQGAHATRSGTTSPKPRVVSTTKE